MLISFIESGAVNEKILDFSGGISGKLPTDTFYDLAKFRLTRTDTDSPLEVLSPNTISNFQFTVGQEILRDFGFKPNLAQINIAVRSQRISQEEQPRSTSSLSLQKVLFFMRMYYVINLLIKFQRKIYYNYSHENKNLL